ncbi:sensor histidine kinase [Clostridium uliginosum]|uniref:histidine kinase n=1 Tax=Clostridium uliginosum TaxID=119641 RepID=A0A1I1RP32_9CLOT|nr:ATP-binding protein [Clostridium uliginosum]SFD34018.1 HAMP domain-containing protein [Clostridium uliginosum]
MKKLKHKLTFSFILFSLGIIILISISANIFVKKNFNNYIQDRLEKRKTDVVKDIDNVITKGNLEGASIENIGINALENGLIIKLSDDSGKVIWDARTHNNGMCEDMLSKMILNMNKINPGLKGNYTVEKYDFKLSDTKKAYLEIGYYGPYYYSEPDIVFFKTLNSILIIVAIVALGLSIIVGIIIATSISEPLFRVVKATNLIARGNYKNKINEKTNVEEVEEIIDSVNKLANILENQEKMRKVLTKDISHELRTPLTTMQVQLEALVDGVWEPTEERLKSIYEETQRLSRLVGYLENLSRYESDNLVLNKSMVDISELISTIMVNFEKQLLDKNIEYESNLNRFVANVDKDKLSQALINIISNGIKYTQIGGKININCIEMENEFVIVVKDSGIGISEENLSYIFERFYRADESRARATGGSGIGLTIAKAIIEAQDGEISVKSKVDGGTEFTIKLPK